MFYEWGKSPVRTANRELFKRKSLKSSLISGFFVFSPKQKKAKKSIAHTPYEWR